MYVQKRHWLCHINKLVLMQVRLYFSGALVTNSSRHYDISRTAALISFVSYGEWKLVSRYPKKYDIRYQAKLCFFTKKTPQFCLISNIISILYITFHITCKLRNIYASFRPRCSKDRIWTLKIRNTLYQEITSS